MDLQPVKKKSKRILCIMPHYHLLGDANNVCMLRILDELKQEGHTVDILCFDTAGEPTLQEHNGYSIITLKNAYQGTAAKYGKAWQELPELIKMPVRIGCALRSLFKERSKNPAADSLNYAKILTRMRPRYDTVISQSVPLISHTIARNHARKIADAWYAVVWDPIVYNRSQLGTVLTDREIRSRKRKAQRILNKADRVLMLEGIGEENARNGYLPEYQKNGVTISLPTLTDTSTPAAKLSEEETLITFAGAFYEGIRRPDDMLKVLSKLPKGYTLQLLGKRCRDVIEREAGKFTECKLIDYGMVPHEVCMQKLSESHILVNVGNTITNQLPSKVFEYIGMGKPIINFYSEKEDPGLKYFKKYPLCYNFYTKEYTEADIDMLIAFCEENKGKQLSFEEATEHLKEYLAENVCKKVIDVILS